MHLGVEDGDADALGGEGIRVRARCSLRSSRGGGGDAGRSSSAKSCSHSRGVRQHCPRRLLLVKPVTAWTTRQSAPARAMAR